MRTLLSSLSFGCVASLTAIAPADPRPPQPPAAPLTAPLAAPEAVTPGASHAVDPPTLPAACKPIAALADVAALSRVPAVKITLARCMAERGIAPLTLCDCAASIEAIDRAVAPALAVLDDVIAAADPAGQALAEHAEGLLYASLVTRMRAALPAVAAGAADAEVALHDVRARALDLQLAPWREAALASFQHVVELARDHPALAGNRTVAPALRDSEQRLAGDVAAR